MPRASGLGIKIDNLRDHYFITGNTVTKFTDLIKNSSIRTNKAPFEEFFFAVGIGDRITNMENLTFIGYIGIVAVRSGFTAEVVNNIFTNTT